jgi:antitoxin VapB
MKTATVVTQSNRQIVHLPMEVHLDGDEVFVKQVGGSVVLVPKRANTWQPLIDSLDQFSADFMEDRAQPVSQKRETIFE